jgi:hypothetical protein
MRRTSSVVIVALLFLQATVVGLIAPPWTFDELRSKSDLIVIAERVATRDVGFKTEFTDLRPPFPVVELNTDFKVLSALKGTPLRAILVLRHYRQDTDRLPGPILNAPPGLDFSRGPTTVDLLFLKRESDGLYAPTSGHVFPEFSILALPKGPLTVFPR